VDESEVVNCKVDVISGLIGYDIIIEDHCYWAIKVAESLGFGHCYGVCHVHAHAALSCHTPPGSRKHSRSAHVLLV